MVEFRMKFNQAKASKPPLAYARRSGVVFFLMALSWCGSATAQSPLPVVDGIDGSSLRAQGKELLDSLVKLQALLPKDIDRELRALLADNPKTSEETAKRIQKLLNAQCLVGVSINPESRVKAARGPRSAELVFGKETVFLIRVVNEAGVTHPLSLDGPQIIGRGEDKTQCWLHANLYPERSTSPKLSGQKVEYVLLRLRAEKAGKREATFIFDVGQGTQDLGFRAEVPILFTIKEE
jgi:hypothetical protein